MDFIFILISHLVIAYYSWNFDQLLPSWVCVLAAVCYFLYFTLDCLDGKQARKIGAGSPLGMMFDHGCDALGTPLSFCNFMALAQCRSTLVLIVCLLFLMGGFFIATFETYYVGGLFLGEINPVTDGSVMVILLYLLSAILGPAIWVKPLFVIHGFTITTFIALIIALMIFQNLVGNLTSFKNILNSKEKPTISTLLKNSFSYVFLSCTAMATYYSNLWIDYPRLMIYLFGIMFTKLNVYTLAMQVVKSKLKLVIYSIICPCILILIHIAALNHGYDVN